jgi:AraC family transcriptional regulator
MFAETQLRIPRFAPWATMAPHQHDEDLMGIVVDGDFCEWIGQRERVYARGHASFFPAGLTHSQRFGSTGARQIIFRPRESWLDYLADNKARLADAPHAASKIFHYLGDRLVEEMRQRDALSAIACEGLLLEFVAAFGRHWSAISTGARAPAWLRAARDFIHENAFNGPSMAQIARAADRHEIHLAREFRRFYGVSIGTYMRRLRAERAARLLRNGQLSISEIAQNCGYASHSHLCREFKTQLGATPSEYRAKR